MLIFRIWTPKILVDEREIFFDWRWEIAVVFNKISHSFSLKIFHFVQNYVNSLVKVAFLFPLTLVELSIELNHWMLPFYIRSSHSILHQFQNTVLNQNHCDIVLSNSVFSKRSQIGVYPLKSRLDSVPTFVVHADADEYFHALEVVTTFFFTFG